MGDVDALQDAEEAVAQLREEQERTEREARAAELSEEPVKETASRERVPEVIALEQIEPLSNIRHDLEQIHELALSIKERGLLQPLLVRRSPEGAKKPYQLVAGRRRYEALALLHAAEASAEVRCDVLDDLSEAEVYELMFTENVQRVPLKPMEVARALRYLLSLNEGMSASALARSLGLRPDWALKHFRLLELPDEVQARLEAGDLTFTVADLLRRGQKSGQVSEDEVKELAGMVAAGEVTAQDLKDRLTPPAEQLALDEHVAEADEDSDEDEEDGVRSDGVEISPDEIERRRELERQADAILAAYHPPPEASPTGELIYTSWSSEEMEVAPAQQAFADGLSKRQLDAYLLGRVLRDLASDEYLSSLGTDRREAFAYAATLEHAELLSGLRGVARHLAAYDPGLAEALVRPS